MGRFFQMSKLEDLGEIQLNKVHIPYWVEGKDRKVAYEFSLGEDALQGDKNIVYVNNPLKHKGFEFYRNNDGYSPLYVLRDGRKKVIYGAYAPLQGIRQENGTYLYRSGTKVAPGSFPFPQDPEQHPLFSLQTEYYPDEGKKRSGDAFFQVSRFNPSPWSEQEELFKGFAALGEMVKAGDYFLSMDEVRYWASMRVLYRPGEGIIFTSFWIGLGGIILNLIIKMEKVRKKETG